MGDPETPRPRRVERRHAEGHPRDGKRRDAPRAELAAAERRGREPGGPAADRRKAGCEAVLALADIKTTHGAFPADEGYGYRRGWGWYDDYDEYEYEYDEHLGQASGSEGEYDIQELIDSEVTLTHWTGRAAPAWRRRRCR